MRAMLCCAAAIALQGCAAISALLPVATSCIPPNPPVMPAIAPNSALAKLDDAAFVYVIAAERIELAQYAKEAAAVIAGCK